MKPLKLFEFSKNHSVLDGLRGLAVLLVLCSHATDLGLPKDFKLNFEGSGRYGVFLFFVLSSYLLSRNIIFADQGVVKKINFWANYSLRRFLRIYPLFIVTISLYIYFSTWSSEKFPKDWSFGLDVLLLQVKCSVFWTIAVEMKFYLLLPLFALLFKLFANKLSAIITLYISLTVFFSLVYPPDFTIQVNSYLPIFITGTFIAALEYFCSKHTKGVLPINSVFCVISLFFLIASMPQVFRVFYPDAAANRLHLWYVPFSVAWGFILIGSISSSTFIRKFFASPPLVFAGRISYSLYLLHMLVLGYANLYFDDLVSKVLFFWCCTSLLSWVSWRIIELPLSKIRISY